MSQKSNIQHLDQNIFSILIRFDDNPLLLPLFLLKVEDEFKPYNIASNIIYQLLGEKHHAKIQQLALNQQHNEKLEVSSEDFLNCENYSSCSLLKITPIKYIAANHWNNIDYHVTIHFNDNSNIPIYIKNSEVDDLKSSNTLSRFIYNSLSDDYRSKLQKEIKKLENSKISNHTVSLVDHRVSPNCKNLNKSYGEICVKCGMCGRKF